MNIYVVYLIYSFDEIICWEKLAYKEDQSSFLIVYVLL